MLNKMLNKLNNQKKRLTSIIIVVLLFIIPGSIASLLYINYHPSANKLCRSCHNMEPFYIGLMQSGHKELNCHRCHPLEPSIPLKAPVIQLIDRPSAVEIKESFSPKISMYAECIKCHPTNKLKEMQIHEVHLGMVELTGSCDTCHDIHASSELDLNCKKCHGEVEMIRTHSDFHLEALFKLESGDTDTCNKCHSPDAIWEVPLSPSCTKGGVEGKGCFTCHTSKLEAPDISRRACTECHR